MNTTADSKFVQANEELDVVAPNESLSIFDLSQSVLKRPLAQKIMHLWCTGQYTKKQIAQILNTTDQTVTKYLTDERVQGAITEYQKQETKLIEQTLKASRNKAMETMMELLDSGDDKIRFQASKDILDRGGFMATQKKEVTVQHKTFEQQLDELIADVDYEDVGD